MPRRFLRRTQEGGGQFIFNNLLSLSWEVLLDSRHMTATGDGTNVTLWSDISGNGRDANPVLGFNPINRSGALASPRGLPLADFGAVPNSQMFGSLPGAGVGNTLGFSFYAWYILDSVPATGCPSKT